MYLRGHDRVASFIHWILCKNFNLPHTEKLYEHTPQLVTERTKVTILWDFTINTDSEANRSDITIKNFEENTCITIDVTVAADKNISIKEFQILSKYKDLEMKFKKCGNSRPKQFRL